MPASSEVEINSEWIAKLLDLPTLDQQTAFLQAAYLSNEDGLNRLLDFASQSIQSDPRQADRLAVLCTDIAVEADASAVAPRATYLRVQTQYIKGDYKSALALCNSAYEMYLALGLNLEAWRTNVGSMTVLTDLGQYQQALNTGQATLEALEKFREIDDPLSRSSAELLTAKIYQNHGFCYEKMGRYKEALKAYALAEERYLDLDETEGLAEIINNRGLILMYLGRVREAIVAFEAVTAISANAGLKLLQAMALINTGEAQFLLGNYSRSLETFTQAHHLFVEIDAPIEQQINQRHMADTYLALNLHSEALAAYREVGRLLQDNGLAYERGWALWGMGSALIAQSQFEEAEHVLNEAAALFKAANNLPLLSSVMLEQTALLTTHSQNGATLQIAQQALTLVSGQDWPVHQIYAHLRVADLLLPDVAAVEPHLLKAQQLVDTLALPHLRYRLNQRLGHVRRLQGHTSEAEELLQAAVAEIEQLRGNLAQEMIRTSFLHDKVAAFEELMQLYLDRSDQHSWQQAFVVAERAKSRALVDLLVGVTETKPTPSVDSELATELQLLQTDLNAIYSELLGRPDDNEHLVPIPDLQARAAELEQEINRLRLLSVSTTTTPDPFATPLSLDAIQAQLPRDIVLLAYHIVGDEIIAFVSWRGTVRVMRNLSTVTIVQQLLQRLAQQWDRFRAGSAFIQRHMKVLEQSTQRLLTGLYTELVAPLESLLTEAAVDENLPQPLAIVPHGLLHQTPFHALFDGQQYLLERFEISYAPSATVLAMCQQRVSSISDCALIVGVPDRRIQAVATEVQAVAQHFSNAAVFLDEHATSAAIQAQIADCRVLHLACHGLFRADNPMFSALQLHDGWLTATDVNQFNLAGSLVTLSACESGRSQVIAGDEIIGLTRAFLGAGAATVVVSLWLVQDETTATLMENWYRQLRQQKGRAAALRAAQLALKANYPHPYYWAPFVLVGQR